MPNVFAGAPRLHLRRRERVVDTHSTLRWIGRGATCRHHTGRHCVTDPQLPEPRIFGRFVRGLGFIGYFGESIGVHDPQLQASTVSITAPPTDEAKSMASRNE